MKLKYRGNTFSLSLSRLSHPYAHLFPSLCIPMLIIGENAFTKVKYSCRREDTRICKTENTEAGGRVCGPLERGVAGDLPHGGRVRPAVPRSAQQVVCRSCREVAGRTRPRFVLLLQSEQRGGRVRTLCSTFTVLSGLLLFQLLNKFYSLAKIFESLLAILDGREIN